MNFQLFSFLTLTAGSYTLTFSLNDSHQIIESNFSNNTASTSLTVYPPPPPPYQAVTMDAFKIIGIYDNTDKELTFETQLTNSGAASYFNQDYTIIIRNAANVIVFANNFTQSIGYAGTTQTVEIPLSLSQSLPVGQYTAEFTCSYECNTYPYSQIIDFDIQQIQYTLNGTIKGEDGIPLTQGNLFLYQKQDNGTVKFIQQTQLSGDNTFTFQLDTHEHTLYFIPDADTYANYVPTIYGKTLILSESSFFTATTDMNVTFDILKVQSLASGSGIISGQVGSGSSNGRVAPMSSISYPVVLLSATGDVVGFTYSDSNGSFTFNNLPRNKYQIVIPLELDQNVMTTPYNVDITSKNEKVNIQLTSNGATLSTEVLMLSQNISFTLASSTSYGADPIDLSATSDAALSVTFTSSDNAIAEVDGDKLIIKGVGTVTITATQNGNDFYSPASKDQQLTINKADQHITFGALPGKTFGDAGFTVEVNSSADLTVALSSSDTNIATVTDNTITIIGAGKATITATQSGSDLYNEAEPVSQDLEITKASQIISFGELPEKTNKDNDFTLSATTSSSLDVSFISDDESIVTIEGNVVTIHGSGTVNITALQNGNQNFEAAASVTRSLLVKNVTGIEAATGSCVLYPNPTKGIVMVKSDKRIGRIEVTDVTGRTQPVNVSVDNQIDLSDAPQGVYFIKLFVNSSVLLYKIVRE